MQAPFVKYAFFFHLIYFCVFVKIQVFEGVWINIWVFDLGGFIVKESWLVPVSCLWVVALVAKPDDLSSIPGIHMVECQNQLFPSYPLTYLCILHIGHTDRQTHTHKHTQLYPLMFLRILAIIHTDTHTYTQLYSLMSFCILTIVHTDTQTHNCSF